MKKSVVFLSVLLILLSIVECLLFNINNNVASSLNYSAAYHDLHYRQIQVFDCLAENGLLSDQSQNEFNEAKAKSKKLTDQAHIIFNSIPEGEVIAKRVGSTKFNVGKNIDVEVLKSEAYEVESKVKYKFAEQEGIKLENTSCSSNITELNNVHDDIKNLDNKYGDDFIYWVVRIFIVIVAILVIFIAFICAMDIICAVEDINYGLLPDPVKWSISMILILAVACLNVYVIFLSAPIFAKYTSSLYLTSYIEFFISFWDKVLRSVAFNQK